MKRAVVLGLAASLLGSGAAYGFWTSTGSGTGTSRSASVAALTITPGTPSTRLYPGGSADVAASIANPNAFAVHVGSLTLDTTQGTGGFAVDAGHTGCVLSVLSFAAQSNAGDGWTVPANGSLAVTMTGALTMATTAVNACQGATVTVFLTATVDLATQVAGTTGLISYWRLGTAPLGADNFAGSAGTTLTGHSGSVAAVWTTVAGADPILSDANRVRRSGTGWALSRAAIGPSVADQAVQADVVLKSLVTGDSAGVAGRLTGTTYYSARYQATDQTWRIFRTVSGTDTSLASAGATLTVGQPYRVRLDLTGTALTLSVNGSVVATATDSSITAAGQAGVQLGTSGVSSSVSDTTGLHLDNFRVHPNTGTAADTAGGNTGTYLGTVVRNEPGALAGDLNGAVTLDGSTGAMQVTSPAGLPSGAAPRSVELWFKRSGTATATLFSYGSAGSGTLFAARLTSATNLRVASGSANRDFALPYGTSDGAWHHVAVTYDGGAVQAYLDGATLGGQGLVLATVLDATGFVLGADLSGSGGGSFGGSLDEAALYGSVLSAATVRDHYRVGAGS